MPGVSMKYINQPQWSRWLFHLWKPENRYGRHWTTKRSLGPRCCHHTKKHGKNTRMTVTHCSCTSYKHQEPRRRNNTATHQYSSSWKLESHGQPSSPQWVKLTYFSDSMWQLDMRIKHCPSAPAKSKNHVVGAVEVCSSAKPLASELQKPPQLIVSKQQV